MKNGPYILVVAPDGYPGKRYRERYVYEHHLVWWKKTGQLVPDGYVLHHKNEIKTDNRISNLELKDKGKHSKDHHPAVKGIKLRCANCNKPFEMKPYDYRFKSKNGQTRFYCGRSCGNSR